MKISDYVNARNNLKKILEITEHNEIWHGYFGRVVQGIVDYVFLRDRFETSIQAKSSELAKNLTEIEAEIHRAIDYCNECIQSQEAEYHRLSRDLYGATVAIETDQMIFNKPLIVDQDLLDSVFSRVASYSDWKFPAILVRPGAENFVSKLLASDPLYLLDTRKSLLQPTVDKFPPPYNNRLRLYECIEDDSLLCQIPNNQYNLIVVWNFFNYRPADLVCKYIKLFEQKLRPGGIIAFSYNDCDYPGAARLAEKKLATYVTGSSIKAYLDELNLEVIIEETDEGNFYWIEAKKPGELFSLRGGQCLAQIVPKY
jgi:hypothetical protein